MPKPLALVLTLAFAVLLLPVASAGAAPLPEGAKWLEATIPSTDGVELHADILRPKHLPDDARTPIILSIGPYFSHAGDVGPAGPVIGAPYDPVGPAEGPSERFHDLINGAKLMERGYTVVLVDIRGFGGSTGCLDWGGPGEQADVVAAVEWAAGQPWSNGKVGMYGKSYDALTGLIGVNRQPKGLAAVIAQQPVYDLYRYLYGDGIRRQNSIATPALYNAIDLSPGPVTDFAQRPEYQVDGANDTQRPGCKALNLADQAGNDDHYSDYWRFRNLIPGARGSNVPLFVTAGLPENNTVSDGLAQYLENHTGYERAWLGPWDHVRGGERDGEGRLQMGREGWYDEVIRFYDRFLKGTSPAEDPAVVVQTYDGVWRPEAAWPPVDAARYASPLRGGRYLDDGQGTAWGSGATAGVWTISKPLPHPAHLAGSGQAVVEVSSPRNGNLAVDVYDVDPKGKATLLTRQAHLLRASGRYALELWSADWKFPAGHRVAVRLTDANTDWWIHQGSQQDVVVQGGEVELPFLRFERPATTHGAASTQLEKYKGRTVTLSSALIANAESDAFVLPPKLRRGDAQSGQGAGQDGAGGRGSSGAPLRWAYALEMRRLRRALRGGLRIRARCSAPCRSAVTLSVAAKDRRRLGLRRRVVARGAVKRAFSGRKVFRLRFTRDARRKLRRTRRVELRMGAVTIDAQGGRHRLRRHYMAYR